MSARKPKDAPASVPPTETPPPAGKPRRKAAEPAPVACKDRRAVWEALPSNVRSDSPLDLSCAVHEKGPGEPCPKPPKKPKPLEVGSADVPKHVWEEAYEVVWMDRRVLGDGWKLNPKTIEPESAQLLFDELDENKLVEPAVVWNRARARRDEPSLYFKDRGPGEVPT